MSILLHMQVVYVYILLHMQVVYVYSVTHAGHIYLYSVARTDRVRLYSLTHTGFLGKSCTRHLNRFWNYVLKGALGSASLVLLMVPLCLGGSLISITLAITAVLWSVYSRDNSHIMVSL